MPRKRPAYRKAPPSVAFRMARDRLQMSQDAFGAALGYQGGPRARALAVWRFETGYRPIPVTVARLARMFERHGVPPEFNQSS